ncbi:MAG: magnesium/cobalt transporter CorA [Myxococcaceae bacterium]|nr:magnesium/cobalt transporter CorA [Myxococcaceae bacterium]
MLSVYVLQPGAACLSGGVELLEAPGTKWVDVTEPTEAALKPLAKRFNLHPLAVEDCLHLDQRPKLEEYPDHQFIVLHGFTLGGKDVAKLALHEVHIFLGADWVITVHQKPHPALETVKARVLADTNGTLGRGADFVTYMVADELVDANFAVLDQFGEALDKLEQIMMERPTPAQLRRAFTLRRTLVKLRAVLSPQRDVVALLARAGIRQVSDRTSLYFRDVYDHLVRIYEQIDSARDLLGNILDLYLSVVANRTNEVTKQLTIFASIFLPMSFVVGFFGQNFSLISKDEYFFPALTALVAIPLSMVLWFRRKRWL